MRPNGDQLNPIATVDASGSVLQRFVYGTRINVPDYMVASGTTYRVISDHLGSVRLVVDATTGVVAQRLDYDEFGVVTLDTSPGFQPFGFAGGIYDYDTGLTRFGARDYDPETGRWTAKDPFGLRPDRPNLYTYAWSNPIRFIDVDGLTPRGYGDYSEELYSDCSNVYADCISNKSLQETCRGTEQLKFICEEVFQDCLDNPAGWLEYFPVGGSSPPSPEIPPGPLPLPEEVCPGCKYVSK